ncbi:structure-specific endonuclease subunit slx1 isoform X2 [Prosopis cineraria]|uniref:structure-specific endonuclease subunit slx1 isoform X2 n=1 Tax=Prosopis cineraria TaxID=364024 RepID=UPI0024102DEC|nr:structure-specific endonuclease subunit slx1 isoform X2 [Prosopis cineraria]
MNDQGEELQDQGQQLPCFSIRETGNLIRISLKQHNGEIKGGAKASRAGRPWICACVICGFTDRSEACVFESKWKAFSRRVPQKKQNKQIEDASLALLQRRQEALNRVKRSLDCNHLEINWHLNLF